MATKRIETQLTIKAVDQYSVGLTYGWKICAVHLALPHTLDCKAHPLDCLGYVGRWFAVVHIGQAAVLDRSGCVAIDTRYRLRSC